MNMRSLLTLSFAGLILCIGSALAAMPPGTTVEEPPAPHPAMNQMRVPNPQQGKFYGAENPGAIQDTSVPSVTPVPVHPNARIEQLKGNTKEEQIRRDPAARTITLGDVKPGVANKPQDKPPAKSPASGR